MDVDEGVVNCNGTTHGEAEPVSNGVSVCSGSDAGASSSGGSKGIQTYNRRKVAKTASSHQADLDVNEALNTFVDNNSCEHANPCTTDCHDIMNGSDSQRRWRNFVLDKICQSLGANQGGLEGCIRDALVVQQEVDSRPVKEFVYTDDLKEKCSTQSCQMPNGSQTVAKEHIDITSNGSTSEPNHNSVTKLCQRAFYKIIISEKFTLLCQLLSENFKGCKVDSLFDFNLVNSRMREGAYEGSPMQFFSDIQLIWKKVEEIGTELTSLAKNLSDMSRTSCQEQLRAAGFDCQPKPEQTEGYGAHGVCTCRCCGEKADGRDYLVCDLCEEVFHLSCIQPTVKEIPPSWYCGSCITSGMGSPHDNCAACDRLNAPRIVISGIEEDVVPINEFEDKSNCSMEEDGHLSSGCKTERCCKICGNEVEKGEKVWRCGHPYCPNTYYHVRCLTPKQLKSYGPCWYCPSCLCRVCLTDRDDDKIVLCDGCDHGYHIYCTEPPLSKIPRGKWFCRKCDEGVEKIRRSRRAYERYENENSKKKDEEEEEEVGNFGKKQKKEAEKGQEGMDMLLSAANTLNYEEHVAANGIHMET